MGKNETIGSRVLDHEERLAKLEQDLKKDNGTVDVGTLVRRDESAAHKDNASLDLSRLKGLIGWMLTLMEGDQSYDAENTRGGLQVIEEWIDGIIEDVDAIKIFRPDLLTACKELKEDLELGRYDKGFARHMIRELNSKINRFLNEDLGQIRKIQGELLGEDFKISHADPPETERASAEPQIQTEARGSDPEGSQHGEKDN